MEDDGQSHFIAAYVLKEDRFIACGGTYDWLKGRHAGMIADRGDLRMCDASALFAEVVAGAMI